MKRSMRWLLLISVSLIATWAGYRAGQHQSTPLGDPVQVTGALKQLFQAPLTDLDGRPQGLPANAGTLLVVNFWASWCPPCRAEMPAFSRIQQKFADKKVQFVGIALDGAEPVKAFLRSTPVSYPVLLAQPSLLELTAPLGNKAQGLPFSLILDRQGQLVAVRLGQWNEANLETQLLDLLPQP